MQSQQKKNNPCIKKLVRIQKIADMAVLIRKEGTSEASHEFVLFKIF